MTVCSWCIILCGHYFISVALICSVYSLWSSNTELSIIYIVCEIRTLTVDRCKQNGCCSKWSVLRGSLGQ